MPLFCDVALAVPLDMVFTYGVPPGTGPVVGGRVLVPFRQQRMSGIVVELHDRPPQVKAQQIKQVIEALDLTPVLDEQLLKLGKWIADYYLAPAGEVFRTMLPLSAEFKRSVEYRITDEGRMALHLAGMSGSRARSKRTPDQQLVEFRVLDYLAEGESVREERLRGATRVAKALLSGMVRKKWLEREDMSAARDAARLVKVAVLLAAETGVTGINESDDGAAGVPARQDGPEACHHTNSAKKLNQNQRTLIETLAAASGGRVPVEALRSLEVPRTTLGTLVRRGLIELVDEPLDFTASKLKPRQSPFEFEFSAAQKEALGKIGQSVASRKFAGLLLHGITGSGKTAVYLACMRQVLDQGRSSILLVPEIGLTPAVAADLHQVFGDEIGR